VTQSRFLVSLALLWLCGGALRLTLLAVPPVLPMVRADLGLSATEVGLLAGLPIGVFALAALPGALLVSRLGLVRAILIGLTVIAAGSALRSLADGAVFIIAATLVMGAGVAVMQPAMPAAVRRWAPQRIGLATAIYTNGLIMSEILPVVLTGPLVLPMLDGSWRLDLVFWSLPIAVTALAVLAFAPRGAAPITLAPQSGRWWPSWHDPLIWRLGIAFGTINATYFSVNAFLPPYLVSQGREDLVSLALSALNFGQLPASLVILGIARRLERKSWPFVMTGLVATASLAGLVLFVGPLTWLFAGLIGCFLAATLILGLTFPPLLSQPQDVARMSAAMFTISYTVTPVIAAICGVAWDLSAVPAAAFVPMMGCTLLLAALMAGLRLDRHVQLSRD